VTKTETELAKTRSMNSQSDQTDLNYLEQQSSTTHNREIDKLATKGRTKLDEIAAQKMLENSQPKTTV